MPQQLLESQHLHEGKPYADPDNIKKGYTGPRAVIDLFEEQAARTPEAVAVVFHHKQLTYRQLNEKANHIAQILQQKGVTEDALVPVCMQRSVEMIVAVVAILKAGGAYLPLDPAYPPMRTRYILEDAQYTIIITDEQSLSLIPGADPEHTLLLAQDALLQTAVNPHRKYSHHRLSYLIYTSGSTGTPKGVQMPDSALYNLLLWQRGQFHDPQHLSVLQFASINFDVSFQEIFSALCFGGSIHLITEQHRKDMALLLSHIERSGITSLFLPYVVLKSLAAQAVENGQYPSRLRDVFTAGEQLKLSDDIETFMTATGVRLHNQYGPSETHVVSSYTIQPDDYKKRPLPPIGKPVSNTLLYILADDGNPCPVGVPGELCIGGAQVARGYRHLPGLSAERFTTDPFNARGGRLYKTGDICRWLNDGNIEYMGRKDEQVKIRGYRVEPGEIEHVLQECELVSQALVVVKGDETDSKRLVAYIVPEGAFDSTAIMSYLRDKLPAYMVPSLLIALDELPLTVNGKINKHALPEPDWNRLAGNRPGNPRNAMEEALLHIWKDVLQVQQLGIYNNFFEAGGNSIMAIRLIAKMQANYRVSVNDLFLHPTVEELSRHVIYRKDHFRNKLAALVAQHQNAGLQPPAVTEQAFRIQKQQYADNIQRLDHLDITTTIPYRKVLLLGATGFLGMHLLHELLHQYHYTVYVIVRAATDAAAFLRLSEKYAFYFGTPLPEDPHALQVFRGDIAQPCFGLDEALFERLLGEMDCLINSAANVKHYGHYDEFEAVNTGAVQIILNHFRKGPAKIIHHISTTGIAGNRPEGSDDLLYTEADLFKRQIISNFYLKSKLAAEQLLEAARTEGMNINIYRTGHLSFHSATGKFQQNMEHNAFYNQVKGFIALKSVPLETGPLEMSNIDQVAQAILGIFDKKALLNRNYHIINPSVLTAEQFTAHLNSYGFEAGTVSLITYLERMLSAYETNRDLVNRLLLDADLFNEGTENAGPYAICYDETNAILKKLQFRWADIDEAQIHRMLQYAESTGFFKG